MGLIYRIKSMWDESENGVVVAIFGTSLIIISAAILVPLIFGYKICWISTVSYDFVAISAVGASITALGSITIPLVAVYLAERLRRNVGQSNAETYNSIEKIRSELDSKVNDALIKINMYSQPPPKTSEQILGEIKAKALKFINISMVTNTKRVAEHLETTEEETFDILQEMVLHDKSISCGGQLRKDNLQNIVWTKK